MENICARVSFLIKLQVFFCEFCEIFKNTFLHRTLPVAASVLYIIFSSTSYVEKIRIKRKIKQTMADSERESINGSPSSEGRFIFRVIEKDMKNMDTVSEETLNIFKFQRQHVGWQIEKMYKTSL